MGHLPGALDSVPLTLRETTTKRFQVLNLVSLSLGDREAANYQK